MANLNTIEYIKKGRVEIFPHIMLDQEGDRVTMDNIAEKIMKKCQAEGWNITQYEDFSYTNEMNGRWNIVFGIQTDDGKVDSEYYGSRRPGRLYTYCLWWAIDIIGLHASPFYNVHYAMDQKVNHYPLSKQGGYSNFEKFETIIKDAMGPECKEIDVFTCKSSS